MTNQFTSKNKPVKQLEKFYKEAPHIFKKISANVLNSMAFADRSQIPKTMKEEFTLRTPSIIKKATRVKMAKHTEEIDRQHSISGSIKTKRHDAWETVQEGGSTRITQFTDAGRKGGTSEGKATKPAKAGETRTTMDDFNLHSGYGPSRIIQYISAIRSEKRFRRKPFWLPGNSRGVYQFKGGSIGTYRGKKRIYRKTLVGAKLIRLSTPRAKVDMKRTDWKGMTTEKAINEGIVKGWYTQSAQRELMRLITKSRFKR